MKKEYIIGLALSLLVIGYVLLNLDWQQVLNTFANLNLAWILVAFSAYLLNYYLRAIRFKSLLELENIPFRQLLGVTNLYGMYLYLMPAKFGEITFPVLLKRRLGIDLSVSTGSLIVARVFDFFTIALILPAVLLSYCNLVTPTIRLVIVFFCVLIFGLCIFFIWMLRHPDTILPRLEKAHSSNMTLNKFMDFVTRIYKSVQTVDQRNKYLELLFLTFGIWLCINTNFFLITLGIGYSFSFFQIVVVSIIMIPLTLFPIQGFANLGAHELGWITAFTLFNYTYQDALNIAVSSHIVYVFFVLLLGLSGILLLNQKGSNNLQNRME